MQIRQANTSDGVFFNLLLLTCFFILLEISYFIQCNSGYLADFTLVSTNVSIPIAILPGILFFIFIQLCIHLFYCFLIWFITNSVYNLYRPCNKNKLAIIFWTLGISTIVVANQYYFPNSKFSELTSILLINQTLTFYLFVILFCFCLIIFLLVLMSIIRQIRPHKKTAVFLLIIFLFSSVPLLRHYRIPTTSATILRPNIILVGVDSLRPDFLEYFGRDNTTPFFDSFLQQASVFSDAVTPLARTFPSWSGVLSGEYPRQTNIRSNLAKYEKLKLTHSLPLILQRNRYETVYATDETRFSNIDKYFGFDSIISPPMGLNDFLIGTFNDFPMSNLLISTTLGKWLFPYSFANRAAYFVYNPDSFLKRLQPILKKQYDKPLFLAVHFCLPHTPYLWADSLRENLTPQEKYAASVKRVDTQIQDFFTLLKRNHLLDHAIVVLFSDHGEALEFPGDRITEKDLFISAKSTVSAIPKFYPPSLDGEAVNQSAGHGTDVLGLSQYHTLLAFKLYGLGKYTSGNTKGVVSLLDIKPTILELLNLCSPNSSGISLAKFIKSKNQESVQGRHIFLESDFSPESIRTVYPDQQKIIKDGVDLFQIDKRTTRLTVKDEMMKKIIKSKQYADIYNEWMLALYPQNKNIRIPILVNLNNGQWTNDLQTKFAQDSPAKIMLAELRAFYGNEIVDVRGNN